MGWAALGIISLGLIWSVPTFCVLPLLWFLNKSCSNVQTCHPVGGGGYVYFLKSARNGRFRNVWVTGGQVLTFFSTELHIGRCTQTCTAHFRHVYSKIIVVICVAFFRQGWDPIGTSIALFVDRDIFLQFPPILQPFDPKTGLQKQWPQQWTECGTLCECMQLAGTWQYEAFWPSCQAPPQPLCRLRVSSSVHQTLLWCFRGSNGTRREFV